MAENLRIALSVGENVMQNVFVMFLLMAIGFLLAKGKILTEKGVKQITELVLTAVVPCVIINAYQRDFDPQMAKTLCLALLFAIIVHFIGIIIVPFLFKKREDKKDRISAFSVIYSNCGFIALPLVQSLYGNDGVFYAVAYITVFNILYWTHGIYLYTHDIKQLSFKKAFTSPGVLGTLTGVVLFFLRIRLPEPVVKTVSFMAALNTPLPMIILGTYIVKLNIKETLKNHSLWAVCALRLLAAPLLGMGVAKLMHLPEVVSMTLVLSCACPVAAVATLFAVRYGLDSEYPSQTVSVSTLLCIVTIPLSMFIAAIIL